MGIRALQDLVEQEEQGSSIPSTVDHRFQSADGGVEERFSALERITDAHGRPDLEDGQRQPLGPNRSTGLGQHEVRPDGPQHRAFARHVRTADQDQPNLLVEVQVVADALAGRNERMPKLAGVETDPRLHDLRKGIIGMLEREAR